MTTHRFFEELLEDLAESLQISPAWFDAAEASYKTLADWLHRDGSSLQEIDSQIYIQGSFQLGTVIQPVSDAEDYDVDLVCELDIPKTDLTQSQLKNALGIELSAYAQHYKTTIPEDKKRCWRIEHNTDGANFHLDILPAIPDSIDKRRRLEASQLSTEWTDTALAITDSDHPLYLNYCLDWPHSNPKGYSQWFRSRMQTVFAMRRQKMAMDAVKDIEEIPEHRVRTPLQYAIQILKRHRDRMFIEHTELKPVSIILTTLAAHAYDQTAITISGALDFILRDMDKYIQVRNGIYWIPNPTDPAENFADRWQKNPENRHAFYTWLNQARADFQNAKAVRNRNEALDILAPRFGERIVNLAQARQQLVRPSLISSAINSARTRITSAAHRKNPPWNPVKQGNVWFEKAIMRRNGFRDTEFRSDTQPLQKNASLIFEADTDVPKPYKVYWQVVNTGEEASRASGLRGGFDEGVITPGKLTRKESTLYKGAHSIECFIVKNNLLAARSGIFIVNIE